MTGIYYELNITVNCTTVIDAIRVLANITNSEDGEPPLHQMDIASIEIERRS